MADLGSDDGQRPGAFHWNVPAVGGLSGAITPFMRTGRYFAQSWHDYLDQAPDELSIARPAIALAAQAFRDEIVVMGLKARRPVSRPEVFERVTREVVAGLEVYGNKGWLEKPKGFFAEPPVLSEVTVRKVKGHRRSFYCLFFDSGYAPTSGRTGSATVAEVHREQPRVRTVAAPPATAPLAGMCTENRDGPGCSSCRGDVSGVDGL